MAGFLDTFTGSGTLATHTSDSGHSYANITGSYNAADLKLDGVGAMYSSPDEYGGAATTFLMPEFYTISIVFEVGAFTGTDYVNFVLSLADGYGTSFEVRQSGGNTQLYDPLGAGWANITPGIHTYSIVRSDNPDGYDWHTLDGVSDWTYQSTQSATKEFKFYVEMTGTSTFKVRSIQIDNAIIPLPPVFWTAFRAATEVLQT